jgi:hypothetical protein
MEEFPEKMLVETEREAPRTGSSNDQGQGINIHRFFNPNGFAIVDLLSQGDSFAAQYFIDQILKPLSQEHSTKSADITHKSLQLHFDNSRCQTAKIVSEEITYLKCKECRIHFIHRIWQSQISICLIL